MTLSFNPAQKLPLDGVAGRFGIESDAAVRGVRVPITERACYASLTDGLWRYWVRQNDTTRPATFASRVGRLLPVDPMEFMARLNDHATGPIQSSKDEVPKGEAVVFDLPDVCVVERFALACATGESLSRAKSVLFTRSGQSGSAAVIQDALPHLNVNVSLWAVAAPDQAVVFLPNAVFLRRDRHQWVVPYAEVDVRLESKAGSSAWTEICLALSDVRVRLQVSDPLCARKAVRALERLIQFEAGRLAHVGAMPSKESSDSLPVPPSARKPRKGRARTSCGKIVIKSKPDAEPADRIVVRVKLGKEAEPPGPDPDQGLATPAGSAAEDALTFCDASGLVFANESQAPPEPKAPRALNRLRSAVGTLLAYVAKASDGFSSPEQKVIREILQLPASFPLAQQYSGVDPNSPHFELATSVLLERSIAIRRRVVRDCERVANADGAVTPKEAIRLAEIRIALEV